MRWLQMVLVSEGASDDLFLPPVLQRSAAEMFGDVADVEDVRPVRASVGPPAIEGAVQALHDRCGMYNLVVVHHDQGRNTDRWESDFRRLWCDTGHHDPVVAVVPVRETETWALADGDALRRVLGVSWDDARLGLPARRRDLEEITDPKAQLRSLVERCHRWDPMFLERLAGWVALEQLRELPAFRRWENDLAAALRTLPGFTKR